MFKVFELHVERMEEIYREEVRAHLKRIEEEKTYWTFKDLQRETGFSTPYIRDHILFDPELGAWRDGNQWRMLASVAKPYLERRGLKKHREQTNFTTEKIS